MMKPEGERDADALVAAKARFLEELQPLERELEGRDYMAGDFSLLDAAHVPRSCATSSGASCRTRACRC